MSTEEEVKPVEETVEETKVNSRKMRPTGSTHFGDVDFAEENVEDIGDATWGEVCQTCCCHTPVEWAYIFVGVIFICLFLYFFLLGLDILGSAAKVIGGCTAGNLLGDDTNPIAALMIGILATSLIQSSSTTTSIVVSLVGTVIPIKQAIFIVMGANIGTTVTNTIVALGQMGDGDQLERAFAGATVHDMFNYMNVCLLLPIEAATGYLYHLTNAMVSDSSVRDGDKWSGPIKRIVSPLGAKILVANKDVIKAVAKGNSCKDFYPIVCEDPSNPTRKSCTKVGLIGCDNKTNKCPAFFQVNATQKDDEISGGVCFFIGLAMLIVCLIGLVTVLQRMLLGVSTRIIYKATNINGYLAIAVGCGVTMVIQSSSITTSTLTPLVGIGVLQLEQMLPLTLGANIGTTLTAILAALVSNNVQSLQVALAHLFFNVTGVLVFYPIPVMRRIPIRAAKQLGKATRFWRGFPIFYIIIMFAVLPGSLLGLSSLFEQDSKGYDVLGSILVVFIFFLICYFVYWWQFRGGKDACFSCVQTRQRKSDAVNALADDMEFLKAKIAALSEHTGLPEDEAVDEEEGETKKLTDEKVDEAEEVEEVHA